ncbi:MAG: GGDEF domain-containing protein [Huintestinicola sp.]|uniref:GGDEF domain-containing protein n=1 Tax=Huintestinicola sp. TaxID=2981661 RepID=UPI003EFD5D18
MLYGKKVVALCLSRINDEVSYDYIMNLSRYFEERDWRLFVYATCTDLYWNTPEDKGESAVFSLINYDVTDAVIIMDEKIKSRDIIDSIRTRCEKMNIPVIFAGGIEPNDRSLEFDYEEGFALVIRHVMEYHGVTDLHMMAGMKGNDFSEKRIEVFKREVEKKGIAFSEDMVSYGDFWSVPTEKAVNRLIEENRLPKAFICANDTMAITVCGVLAAHNIRVPEDIIVTGFDGIEAIKFSVPKITSCLCSFEDMARETANVLDRIFAGSDGSVRELITPRVIISESCGCHCAEPINTSLYLNDVNDRFFRFQEDSYAINNISTRIQMCRSIEEVAKKFDNNQYFYNMVCVLKPECIDETINPLSVSTKDFSEEKLFMLFNTDYSNPFEPYYFNASEMFAGIEAIIRKKVPLIFFALNFLENPLGFVCFHFNNFDMANYTKMPQTINAMSTAIGSYRNMRYQHYLNTRIEEMYKSDALTGLYNRSGFIKEYDRLLEEGTEGLTVILADLDGLKNINDTYGHGEGDVAIRAVALALKACCPEEAVCARFGGDEMIAVINGECTSDIKGDIAKYLESYTASSGKPYTVSASVGIYRAAPEETGDFKEILKKSDKLMYMDKARKKQG